MYPKLVRVLLAIVLSLPIYAAAQPEPCISENPEMTPFCEDACIVCDIDGFMGRHESEVIGSLPADFCTFVVHNAQWIAFQAASTNLQIELSVSNCDMGNGLEMAIYKSTDCNSFEMISNCRGGTNAVSNGTSAVFETTEPLVIGQYYYLAMDGNFGDNCDWTFEVLEGSTQTNPLTLTLPIEGADILCPNVLETYSTDPEEGAVIFDWVLNGQLVGDNTVPEIELSFDETGTYTLCVTARNACADATSSCKTIEVFTIPPTSITAEFCSEDCYEIDGNTFCESGTYEYSIPLDNGCDSTIILNLTKLEQPINNIDINICDGDTIFIGSTPYTSTGAFTEILQNVQLCDSIVNLELNVVNCTIESQYTTTSTICHGASDGTVTFTVENGTPLFYIFWQHLQSGQADTFTIVNLNEMITLDGFPAGEVVIQIFDVFGNTDVIIAEITEPAPIVLNTNFSDYNGFNISCDDAEDGTIQVVPEGGVLPYTYTWSTGAITDTISQLSEGNYAVTLLDDIGCQVVQNFELTAPNPINANVQFIHPTCDGLETGVVLAQNVLGGTGTYEFALNSANFQASDIYENLAEGLYTLSIQDENGCEYEAQGELIAPEIPVLNGETIYVTKLGCEVPLNVFVNDITIQSINWDNPVDLDCTNCLDPIALPFETSTLTVGVMSEDGCVDSLTLSIRVDKTRRLYAPNAFSPNDDGRNDTFYLYGSKEVASIDLTIFNRWGSLVFEAKEMLPEDTKNGWDGTFNGKQLEPGIYVWTAEVHYIDDYTTNRSGDVLLIR